MDQKEVPPNVFAAGAIALAFGTVLFALWAFEIWQEGVAQNRNPVGAGAALCLGIALLALDRNLKNRSQEERDLYWQNVDRDHERSTDAVAEDAKNGKIH